MPPLSVALAEVNYSVTVYFTGSRSLTVKDVLASVQCCLARLCCCQLKIQVLGGCDGWHARQHGC
jgi:hypothetical protein